ncbi:maleylpyruvate isomerase family mycothiol-dependent enzyme [Streptomyces sp. SID10853]|uniref:maleylpyruvate isomerase family mycothiol-dependent enzyme n=1 Tax=Streptomyces sp. SID10853 TaxID=2706028 RepID=UPI0013C10BF7|nr:maleylpyruvate isomerase family mycothiol-dependent enzyme [Streptomyces sp. SID10853]NDZ81708.1 maleylpyruvate isomerase family mycothiol-dependent enzyme [Streptomyces sp. SID10853]
MTLLGHDRYCDELLRQTGLLRSALTGTDLTATVPTCPDWSLGELARHVGRAQRWAEAIVRTKATEAVPPDQVPDSEGAPDDAPAALDTWLEAGAARLAATLREAGPDAAVWTWAADRRAGFWARRMVHETAVHRADAALTAGVPFEVEPEVAADTIDEWLEILAFAQASGDKDVADLRGAGRSIHLHATDAADAEWLIEFGDDGFSWRRGHEKATVALRGPLVDVLQVFYRRLPATSDRVEVLGDRELLDFWLERASF